jgi:hypothetical protein
MSDAFSGIRVIELCDPSAALAGRLLADLGAEVILAEPPRGSALRHEAPFLDGRADPEHGFGHLYLNANKRSVIVDPATDDGRDRLLDLIASASSSGTSVPNWPRGSVMLRCSTAQSPEIFGSPLASRSGRSSGTTSAGGVIWP